MPIKQPPKLFCPRCDDEAHENTVEHKVFYYCRTCKTEVYSPAAQPRKRDIVKLNDLQQFYTDTEGDVHCGHCTAKQGESHSVHCQRNARASTEGQMQFELWPYVMPAAKQQCSHSATYSYDAETAFCLLCNKDLS